MKLRSTSRTGLHSSPPSRQHGYILISILFFLTLAIIAFAAAVPAIKTRIQRDREEELIHRGNQYVRAIKLYYRKFGRYPSSIDELQDTNRMRFLRQKYKDPITGKDEWKLIRFGQAHVKPRPAYLKGATPASSLGANPAGGPAGTGTGRAAGAGVSNASDISKPLSGSPTLGGGPIVGVASTSEKEGLKEIDGKTKYNEWEFVYDPTLDQNVRQQPGLGQAQGGPPGGQGTGGERPSRPPR